MNTPSETITHQAPQGGLSYNISGAGPWLVLVHAGIADRRMWEPQIEHLSRCFRVLRYDMRGFGTSPQPDAPFSHHEDLRDLLRGLGASPVNLVALSMGASVAIDFVLTWPEMVDRLVLWSVLGPPPRSQSLLDGWAAAEAAFERDGLEGVNEVEMQIWVDGPDRTPDMVDPDIRRSVAEMNLPILQHDEGAGFESTPLDPPAHTRLHEIQAPALVLAGDEDQPDVIQYCTRLAEEIPGARLELIHGAAHMVNMEAAARFNTLVDEFLGE